MKDNWGLRANEKTTFGAELRVIPSWLKALLAVCYLAALAVVAYLSISRPRILPASLVHQPALLRVLAMAAIATGIAIVVGGFAMLIGYVGGDAKRRGMTAWIWVLVALFVPYLIGVILYFVVRGPLPTQCPKCGTTVAAQFNFCPSCKFNLRPNCPQCRLAVRPGHRYCPQCGFSLLSEVPAQSGTNAV